MLGVGSPRTPEAPAAPVIAVVPTREKTVLGIGSPAAPMPRADPDEVRPASPPAIDRSLPIALVTTKAASAPAAPPSETSLVAAGVPRRRGRRWPAIVLLILVGAGCGAYAMRARIPWLRPFIDRASSAMHLR